MRTIFKSDYLDLVRLADDGCPIVDLDDFSVIEDYQTDEPTGQATTPLSQLRLADYKISLQS